GFEIHEDKIQYPNPWTYLGFLIREKTIVPQQLAIRDDPKTLRDLDSLCGSISLVCTLLGITTEDLAPLFNLLHGNEDLDSPCTLTTEAQDTITKVQEALSSRQAHHFKPKLPFQFVILRKAPRFYGLIFQWDLQLRDPLLILEWIFTNSQPSKTITTFQEIMGHLIKKARTRLRSLFGCEFTCIYLPLTTGDLEHLLQTNENLQFTLDSYTGQISIHIPKHKLFNAVFNLTPKLVRSKTPLKALTIFTDGSGSSHKSVMTWKDPKTQSWQSDIQIVEGSPQIAELAAVEKFKDEPFNLVTDSAYVAGIAMRAEHTLLKEVSNPKLHQLISALTRLISHRKKPYHIMHVRSHTDLPGFITEGNRKMDALAMAIDTANAKMSHAFFHQNAPALCRQFKISKEQARAILATCPNCQSHALPSLTTGVNPRGLGALETWQTDITHFPSFGWLKYIHVSVDTFSGAVFASTHTGEK
ncbi:POK8 protein, partial [Vidua chalybeata]|nr:POK8 protein [Vidua chalybeata]